MTIIQEWVSKISLRQQGVLLLGLRGPDGVKKEDPAKGVIRNLRGMVMIAARHGRAVTPKDVWADDPFMTISAIAAPDTWSRVTADFFDNWDAYNIHFLQHLFHAFAICGIHYPESDIADRAWAFYVRCADKLHLPPETKQAMQYRLRDGKRAEDGRPA